MSALDGIHCPDCGHRYDAEAEAEQQKQLIDTWRIALQTIARGNYTDDGEHISSGRWGRIALEALDKEKS